MPRMVPKDRDAGLGIGPLAEGWSSRHGPHVVHLDDLGVIKHSAGIGGAVNSERGSRRKARDSPDHRCRSLVPSTAVRVAGAVNRNGHERYCTDWQRMMEDPRVDVFDNCARHTAHSEPSIAATKEGKHVPCGRSLGRNSEETGRMLMAVRDLALDLGIKVAIENRAADLRARDLEA